MTFLDGIKQMRKYGGMRLLLEYCRMGLAGKILRQVVVCIIKRKPLKSVYYAANRLVAPILLRQYEPIISEGIRRYGPLASAGERSKIVWFCWLQGREQMPDIVRACYHSQLRHIQDREFRFIDESNWRDYVSIPDDLVRKYERGLMPAAMFSDLVRLELLIHYGGSWIDSTVLCTGGYDPALLDADIFMYQYGHGDGVSNWFITSCTDSPILLIIRDVLHAYWRDYDVVLHYYLFHLLFQRLMPAFPELIGRMPYADSYPAISLVRNWHKPFRPDVWERLTREVHFHKLAWKVSTSTLQDPTNYYNHIISAYSAP